MAAPQPQFSPKQVASALQASESSVKRWCDDGDLAAVRPWIESAYGLFLAIAPPSDYDLTMLVVRRFR